MEVLYVEVAKGTAIILKAIDPRYFLESFMLF